MLSSDDIARMRATTQAARPDSIQILRVTAASDGAGGSALTWDVDGDPIAARLVPTGGDELEIANRLRTTVDFTLDLPPDIAVLPSDRLYTIDDRTLEVVHVRKGGAWSLGTRVFCREVK